jgi:hypothetical protein
MVMSGAWPMKEELFTDALVREFLLGKLDDDDTLEGIENFYLTNSATRERVLALEQDLIEDYLEDNLSDEDKKRFVSRYAQTAEQRRQLRITKSIKDWAVKEPKAHQVTAAPVPFWSGLWPQLRLRAVFVVPIAVTIVIAIVLAIVWLNSRREVQKHLVIERELVQLNSPASLREVPAGMISQELKPVTVRSLAPQTVSPSADIVELRLPWIQNENYSTYEAEVRGLGDDEAFTIRDLHLENNVIRIRLRTHILSPGQYQISLRGIANDGSPSPSQEYSFTFNG